MMNRRKFAVGALAAGTAPAGALAAGADARPAVPGLDFVFEAVVTLGPPLEMGEADGGRRRFVPITGGRVSGPRLSGVVLPGGGDRQDIGRDGVTAIRARYLLRAADGAVIGVDNPGVRVASPEVITRLTAGEDLDPALYYFRTTPNFDVEPGGPHDWMRRSVFVCQGVRHPATVALRFFRVL